MKQQPHIPETALSRMWAEQLFRPDSLVTTDGRGVQVIWRGRKNTDNGPDFTQALIRIGDHVEQGDVELHLTMGDWRAHGHDADPAYNRAILHVVFWPSRSENLPALTKANGEPLASVIVQSCLSAPIDALLEYFQQTDDQRQQKFAACQNAARQLSAEQLSAPVEQAGRERFSDRARRFQRWLTQRSCEQVLYEAICEGLGYSSNKEPFLELARRLPLHIILSHLPQDRQDETADQFFWIQALIFGAAGLLPALSEEADEETRRHVERLRAVWEMVAPCLDVKPMPPEAWHFFHLRPSNFPTRRLAALCSLALHYTRQPLFDGYLDLFRLFSHWPDAVPQSVRLLERTLEIPARGYWRGRYRFGPSAFSEGDHWLLGRARIRDMLISSVLPFFCGYAIQTDQPDLETQIVRLFDQFPAPQPNRVIHLMTRRLLPGNDGAVVKNQSAAAYQGMLHLYHRYCSLPACSQCPLHEMF